jgi:capsular polysaccharide transport system permease protein
MTEVLNKYKKRLSFWIVGLPMILALVYFLFFAADRFVSESVISVKQSGEVVPSPASGLAAMFGATPPSREDTLYLREYIRSLDMLKHLQARLNLRQAYEAERLDPLYRLYAGTSQEWLHWYFGNRVEIIFDDLSGLLKLRVQAFDPVLAQAINQEILAQSERFVNEVSHRMAREQMAFAEAELLKARDRYQAAKARLVAFQNRHKLLDPIAQAQAQVSLSSQLEGQLAQKETELKALLGYLQEDAYQVVSVKQQIAALKSQLEQERGKVASGQGGRLNTLAAEFQNLTLDVGFAEDAYKAALSAVETTRIEASRKLKSLVVVSSPGKPEVAEYPQRFYDLVTLLLGLTLFYGIVRLVIATVQDHRD